VPGTEAQNDWILRVLNLAVPAGQSERLRAAAALPIALPSGRTPRPIRYVSVDGRAIWNQARQAVLDQFDELRDRLAEAGDADMQQIADKGYGALIQRVGVQMQAAMIEVDAAPPERAKATRTKARQTIAEYRKFLGEDRLFRQLDENPLGVPMSIRDTLGDALTRIEQALG
jgi:hypothetical protein